ncbi:MAG: RloB family protein [Pseudomonadota bacterium]
MARDKPLPKSKKQKKREKAKRPVALGRYLIVCEGEKTEPNYFKWYKEELKRLKNALAHSKTPEGIFVIELGDDFIIEGVGRNTKSLLEYTIEQRNRATVDYDQVWCVFDRDSFPAQDFNEVIFSAAKQDIKVARSNEAFELWYLLHYHYYDTGISRKQYQKMLTALLKKPYQKNSETMYEDLQKSGGKQEEAINNAKTLLSTYGSRTDYADHNPSTTVHELVKALNDYLDEFKKRFGL